MEKLQLKHKLGQIIFSELDLTPSQIDELCHPKEILMKDQAIMDVAEFIKTSHKLMICGDFDADGITSTSIAVLLAKALGIECGYYIPDRIKEGYGTSVQTIQLAHDKGYTHVLMVDNGVKCFDAIDHAKKLGLKIAIVDHHNIGSAIEVDAFLHPDLIDDYGHSMSGAGLMYLVAEVCGLNTDAITILSALGTIADVMPLWGKNREIVIKGLQILNEGTYLQVDVLAKRTRFTKYTASLLAFQVIPKMNSVGRLSDMANVNTTVQFFVSDDRQLISSYAEQMEQINELRKKMSLQMSQDAMRKINPQSKVNIIIDSEYHEGILGIVANQILQQTGKPTIIMKDLGTHVKGSSRSSTISLSELYGLCDQEYFVALGGHDFAYGLTVRKEALHSFISDVEWMHDSLQAVETKSNVLDVDDALLSPEALIELDQFEPYGEGFKLPSFKVKMPIDYSISPIKDIGFKYEFKHSHLQEAVIFRSGIEMDDLHGAQALIGQVSYNSFRKVSMLIQEIIEA